MLKHCLLFGMLLMQLRVPGRDPSKFQVVILTGYNSTPMHQWRINSEALRRQLESSGEFEVRINQEPNGATEDTFRDYDVLLLDYSNYTAKLAPAWPESTRQAYLNFLKNGKGVVTYHAACGSFQEWPEFRQTLGIADYKNIGHGPYHTFTVQIRDPDHPVTKGLNPRFEQWGEIYNGMTLAANAHMLASALDDPKNCGTSGKNCGSGKPEPILWSAAYGKGRVFVTVLGHDLRSISGPAFSETLVRGTKWAAVGQ